MKLFFVAIVAVFLSYSVGISAALAQGGLICGEREALINKLFERHQEERLAIATSKGRLVELFVSPESRSWTIMLTKPRGPSCLIVDGQGFFYKGIEETKEGNKS